MATLDTGGSGAASAAGGQADLHGGDERRTGDQVKKVVPVLSTSTMRSLAGASAPRTSVTDVAAQLGFNAQAGVAVDG